MRPLLISAEFEPNLVVTYGTLPLNIVAHVLRLCDDDDDDDDDDDNNNTNNNNGGHRDKLLAGTIRQLS